MIPYVVLNGATATGVGKSVLCKDFKHVVASLYSSGVAGGEAFTVQFVGSIEETCPDFSTAKSATNAWDYVQAIKIADGSIVDGATGDTFSGANDVRLYELNTNGLTWVGMVISSVTGSVVITGKMICYDKRQ